LKRAGLIPHDPNIFFVHVLLIAYDWTLAQENHGQQANAMQLLNMQHKKYFMKLQIKVLYKHIYQNAHNWKCCRLLLSNKINGTCKNAWQHRAQHMINHMINHSVELTQDIIHILNLP
jgi:hypothetical protein